MIFTYTTPQGAVHHNSQSTNAALNSDHVPRQVSQVAPPTPITSTPVTITLSGQRRNFGRAETYSKDDTDQRTILAGAENSDHTFHQVKGNDSGEQTINDEVSNTKLKEVDMEQHKYAEVNKGANGATNQKFDTVQGFGAADVLQMKNHRYQESNVQGGSAASSPSPTSSPAGGLTNVLAPRAVEFGAHGEMRKTSRNAARTTNDLVAMGNSPQATAVVHGHGEKDSDKRDVRVHQHNHGHGGHVHEARHLGHHQQESGSKN